MGKETNPGVDLLRGEVTARDFFFSEAWLAVTSIAKKTQPSIFQLCQAFIFQEGKTNF